MASCEHTGGPRFRVCPHLMERPNNLGHVERFTGRGVEREYVCKACREASELVDVCAACRDEAADSWEGIVGTPQTAEEESDLWFEQRLVEGLALPAFADVQPLLVGERPMWIGVTAHGEVHRFDLERRESRVVGRVPESSPADIGIENPMLRVSADGRFVAVVDRRGVRGMVLALDDGTALPLVREDYHAEQCTFPIAFVERGGRQMVVWAPTWNRLDIVDARNGAALTPRESPVWNNPRPTHYLDYFHAGISVSPDGRWIADNGWVWHPVGIVVTWSIDRWLHDNVWESEDGDTRRPLAWRDYFWDGPICWLDDTRLGVYGYGQDDEWLIPALRIFDVVTGDEQRWFPGPRGALTCDRELYSVDDQGASVWHIERGTRVARDARLVGAAYHPSAKSFLSRVDGLVEYVPRGHDVRASWMTNQIRDMAERIAREKSFDDLDVLGDALEAAGCTDTEMLAHCHHRETHGERCWVVDRLVVKR